MKQENIIHLLGSLPYFAHANPFTCFLTINNESIIHNIPNGVTTNTSLTVAPSDHSRLNISNLKGSNSLTICTTPKARCNMPANKLVITLSDCILIDKMLSKIIAE